MACLVFLDEVLISDLRLHNKMSKPQPIRCTVAHSSTTNYSKNINSNILFACFNAPKQGYSNLEYYLKMNLAWHVAMYHICSGNAKI